MPMIPFDRQSAVQRSRFQSVRQLFASCRCAHVPSSRTTYVWQLPEIARFLMEIEEAADSEDANEPVYLGTISGWRRDTGDLHLADGVRRLVAVILFLATARDRLPGGGLKRRLERMLAPNKGFGSRAPAQGWLRLPDSDRAWFDRTILAPGATLALPQSDEPIARRQILVAARFFARALDDYSRDDLEERTLCLLDQATICLAATPELVFSAPALPLLPPLEQTSDPALLAWLTPAERQALEVAQDDDDDLRLPGDAPAGPSGEPNRRSTG